MRLASEGGVGRWERQAFRWFRLRKRIHQYLRYRPGCEKHVVFIFGCQRSGTSLLSHLFRLDWDTITYDEMSPLSTSDPEGFRLNPLPEVRARIAADRAPLVVCKPLVESQNAIRILDAVPGSRAIWMFRDYRGVVRSNLRFFGPDNGRRDLAPILGGSGTDWRSEGLEAADSAAARSLLGEGASGEDAAALFWYFRNILAFRQGLDRDERVQFCDYDRLVTDPKGTMAQLYRGIGRPYPGDRIVADVAEFRPGAKNPPSFAPAIADRCDGLLARLKAVPGS
ncbi:hypothetical protein KDM41_14090 [bacterium]|nr:hypothetical protein [bacterium]